MKTQASRADDLTCEYPPGFIPHPTQFRGLWSGGHNTPERELAMAVLENAVTDLLRHRFTHCRYRQRLYWQAYEWVASPDWDWPFSFLNICECLRLSPEALRARLLRTVDAGWLKALRSVGATGAEALLGADACFAP
jgi:hypothetical protein